MGILNKEIRITAVDAGYTSTIDRISEDTKKKLAQNSPSSGIGELIDEAEQKFESVGDQVRYIAEELNKLKVGKDIFDQQRAQIRSDFDPKIRKAYNENNDYDMQTLSYKKRSALKQVDKDEDDQAKVNEELVEVLGKLKDSIDKQALAESKIKRPVNDQIEQEDKQQKKWWSFLGVNKRGGRLTEEDEARYAIRRATIGQRVGGIAAHSTGNAAIGQSVESLVSGAGGAAAIIALVSGIVLANNEFTNKKGRVAGMTSMNDDDLFGHYLFNSRNGNKLSTDIGQLGKDPGEMMQYLIPILRSRGSRDGVMDIGMRQLRMEKGFGLEEGSLSKYDTYSRADNTSKDASRQIMLFIQEARTGKMFGFEKGDFSQLGEKIDQFGRLTSLQAQQSEIANQRMSMKLIQAGSEIGGSFADNRSADQFSRLNSAVTSPQGSFRQAYIMNRIHNANPGDDYFQVRKRMEQGIFGEGNLKSLLGGVTPQGNSKAAMDDYYLRIQSLTGLSFSASEMLGKKIHSDKTFLDRYSRGDKKAMGEIGFVDDQGRTLQQRGSDQVGTMTSAWSETKAIMQNTLPAINQKMSELVKANIMLYELLSGKVGKNNTTKK